MADQNSNEETNRGLPRSIYQKAKGIVPLGARIFLARRLLNLGNRLTQLNRSLLSNKYLSGEGIEIGALHSPLQVNGSTKVKYVDRLTKPELQELYPELDAYEIVETDILDDGQHLNTIQDSSQDFVIANHFLEHCPNPLGALKTIYRVLKLGGVLFMALPDKRFTFDVERPVTDIDHVLRDFEEGPEWSKRGHYEEWVRIVAKLSDKEAEEQIQNLMLKEAWIHFHVWTQYEMFELLEGARKRLDLNFEIECFLKSGEECIFILRKIEPRSEGVAASDSQNAVENCGEANELIKDA